MPVAHVQLALSPLATASWLPMGVGCASISPFAPPGPLWASPAATEDRSRRESAAQALLRPLESGTPRVPGRKVSTLEVRSAGDITLPPDALWCGKQGNHERGMQGLRGVTATA